MKRSRTDAGVNPRTIQDLTVHMLGKPNRSDSSVQDVLGDVRSFLADRRAQTDQWFFLVRMILGLGLVGYLLVDALGNAGSSPVQLVLVGTYLLCNLFVWLVAARRFGYSAWFYAAFDVLFFLLQRHLFLFEATVDPNATMVGFFSLLLVAYVSYGDRRLIAAMATVMLVGTAISFWVDVMTLENPALGASLGAVSFRTHPLRVLTLLAYLGAVGLVAHMLARRLEIQVTSYSSQLMNRAQAAMTTAVERARRERLEELNRLKRDFISVLSHELRTPIAPLRTSLEMVQHELNDSHSAREMMDIAIEASTRLQRLVQDYTRLAELLTLEGTGLESWNLRLADLLHCVIPETERHRYDFDGTAELAVSGDPRLLSGAIVALVRRAELVTPEHEIISIRGQGLGQTVIFSVHDPVSYLDQDSTINLTDPFAYSSERAYFSANTGLELILAQHSIQRVGGSMRVESSRENGTTVHVTIASARPGYPWIGRDELRQELATFAF